jgi:aminoglycoside phosphotransferase
VKQPQKWRKTVDPFSIKFNRFTLSEVLGYPHAANDVFYVKGTVDNKPVTAFLKVERHVDANVENEIQILRQIPFPFVPRILDHSLSTPKFILTEELPGERLSVIVGENTQQESFTYLPKFGKALAAFHRLEISCDTVRDRRVFHAKPKAYFEQHDLLNIYHYLEAHQPTQINQCFVHGDFHYANILWLDEKISAVLDYELSGVGNREFDIAWACFLRPGQKFLNTREEVELFLEGYASEGDFSREAFIYYFLLIASWFYAVGDDEPGYQNQVKVLTAEFI